MSTTIETGTEHLRAEVSDGVATLTMNRPERRNALTDEMVDGLAGVLADLETDDNVGCVVLTGAGGAFCAGGDVKGMTETRPPGDSSPRRSRDAAMQRQRLAQRAVSGRLWSMPKPTIAAIPGPAAGAGLSLAMACDLRYSTPNAVLTTAFGKVGFSGDYGGSWFLTRLVGPAKAKELYYFSDRLTAAEGERLGLLNAIFPEDDFDREVRTRASRLASGPTIALRYMKENLNRAVFGELGECMDMEVVYHHRTRDTEDHQEAARAFVEKREPKFQGR
jgi:2-(1,2-epoxy-1,2-dihydrophenyl)acetyl-CoA isomerase